MTQHFFGAQISYQFATMHTVSYEFLMKPEESAGCHQTLSSRVGAGHETRIRGNEGERRGVGRGIGEEGSGEEG